MIERRELITICRQIGTMSEVGVDILKVLRVLREQTENPRLLELYSIIESEMRMGGNLSDAVEKVPDIFSPFSVSILRQGEARGDIEGAWHRLADYFKQEAVEDRELAPSEAADSARNTPSERAVASKSDGSRDTDKALRALSGTIRNGALLVSASLLVAALVLRPAREQEIRR